MNRRGHQRGNLGPHNKASYRLVHSSDSLHIKQKHQLLFLLLGATLITAKELKEEEGLQYHPSFTLLGVYFTLF